MRLAFGFLLSPILPILLYGMLTYSDSSEAIFIFKIFGILAYCAAVFIGLPTYFIFKRIKREKLIDYAFAGFLIGLLMYFIVRAPDIFRGFVEGLEIKLILFCSLYGLLSAIIFWIIAKYKVTILSQE